MNSKELLSVVQAKYPMCALVRELTLADEYMRQEWINSLSPDAQRWYKQSSTTFDTDPDFKLENGKFTRRIDGLMLHQQKWTALEVKVSRADFFRDTYEKRKVWMDHTHRFIYLTPPSLITLDEVPPKCGWWVVENGRLRIMKRATVNKTPQPLPESFLRTVFFRLATRERKL